jgi:hypothetical protein
METTAKIAKTTKEYPAFVWVVANLISIGMVTSLMFLLLRRAHWDPYITVLLVGAFAACFWIALSLRRMSRLATATEMKLEGQWILVQLTVVVLSLLIATLTILK